MECCFPLALLALLVVFYPVGKMLLGTGPNSLRRLMRLDIAAFFVLTAAFAIALSIARLEQSGGAVCLLIGLLPPSLAAAWLGRYLIEDLVANYGRRRASKRDSVDFTFLSTTTSKDEAEVAEIVEEPRQDKESDG